jgi:hypothetical protein
MGKYDDIIDLPRHVSQTHAQMPLLSHAAQFSSFAALTGFDAAVSETARLTEARVELDRDALDALDGTIRALSEASAAGGAPEAEFRFFVPDERKDGGRYETLRGAVEKVDAYERRIVFSDGRRLSLEDIVSIELL